MNSSSNLARVCVLGSTGSIGSQTLDVISRNPARFQVFALAAGKNAELLAEQCQIFQPRYAVLGQRKASSIADLHRFGKDTTVLFGEEALAEMAAHPQVDIVVAGMAGSAGLLPTMAAAGAGKHVLLANKEALVMAGRLLIESARKSAAVLLPTDSEHNAVFQCLGQPAPSESEATLKEVKNIVLTASGGAFYKTPLPLLKHATPEEACKHPKWSMGKKISVDSATMMNKGLEVIEAHLLFSLSNAQIQVLIHPQSVVHGMVRFHDGSMLAHLANTDMRVAISHALAWPERIASGVTELDFRQFGEMEFSLPEPSRYPCLKLARDALESGHSAIIALSETNEVAVQSFLEGRISFTGIAAMVAEYMQRYECDPPPECLADVMLLKEQARRRCQDLIKPGDFSH